MGRIWFLDKEFNPDQVADEFVVLSSELSPWDGIVVEEHVLPPLEEETTYLPQQYLVSLQLSIRPVNLEWNVKGEYRNRVMNRGDLMLACPFESLPQGRWDASVHILRAAFEPVFFDRIATEINIPNSCELELRRDFQDPQVERLMVALDDELKRGCPSGRLFGESLGTALAVHLMTLYSTAPKPVAVPTRGLSASKLNLVRDYIQSNLDRNLSLRELAELLQLSQFHFSRLFKLSTGLSPHQFLIQCRVERARRLLLGRRLSISEVAQAVGFSDQSHLTRHFRRYFGHTPKQTGRP